MPEKIKNVSVIMPAYNAEKHIKYSVNSVLNQTFKDFELIIVNDGSEDNTEKIIESFKDKRIKYFKTENKGTAAALNYGISKASYGWIARIDSDDLNTPDRLARQIGYLENNPQTDIISSWSVYFNNKKKILFFLMSPVEHNDIVDAFNLHNPLNQSGLLCRKNLLEQEKYNENLHLYEDFELYYRIREKVKFHNIPEYLVYTRMHRGSKSNLRGNDEVYDMLKTPAFKNMLDSKSKGDHFYWAGKIAWVNFFYGDPAESRGYFRKSISLKNTTALIATFLPDKIFHKLLNYRLKYRFFSLFRDKKRYKTELKNLLN
jgi:glycosyltransferase involved in cell wall biosynthesis